HRKVGAEQLVNFMLHDLRDTLDPLGKLALLEQPARQVLAYFGDRELATDEREERASALEHLGDALRSKGDLAGAETQLRAAVAELAKLSAAGDRIIGVEGAVHLDLADVLALRGSPAAL